jgi:hypothetical protein
MIALEFGLRRRALKADDSDQSAAALFSLAAAVPV